MSFLDPAAKPAPKKPKTRGPVKHVGTGVAEALEVIFSDTYRELRPRAPMPSWDIRFYRFAHVNNTIRLREGQDLCPTVRRIAGCAGIGAESHRPHSAGETVSQARVATRFGTLQATRK